MFTIVSVNFNSDYSPRFPSEYDKAVGFCHTYNLLLIPWLENRKKWHCSESNFVSSSCSGPANPPPRRNSLDDQCGLPWVPVECLGSLWNALGPCGMHGVPVECLESLWNAWSPAWVLPQCYTDAISITSHVHAFHRDHIGITTRLLSLQE